MTAAMIHVTGHASRARFNPFCAAAHAHFAVVTIPAQAAIALDWSVTRNMDVASMPSAVPNTATTVACRCMNSETHPIAAPKASMPFPASPTIHSSAVMAGITNGSMIP